MANKAAVILSILLLWLQSAVLAQNQTAEKNELKLQLKHAEADSDKVNILLQLSNQTNCKDSVEKVKYVKQALDLAQSAKDLRLTAIAYEALASINVNCLSNQGNAIKYYTLAANVYNKSGDSLQEHKVYASIGFYYDALNNYPMAVLNYKKALSMKTVADNEGGIWANLGQTFMKIADYPKALECFTTAMKISNRIFNADQPKTLIDSLQMSGLLITIGGVYINTHDYKKAINNFQSAIDFAGKYSEMHAIAFLSIGKAREDMGYLDSAKIYYHKALVIDEETKNVGRQTMSNRFLANIYLLQGQPEKAMKYCLASMKLAESNDLKFLLPITYTTLAKIYTYIKEYGAAVKYLKKAIAIAQETEAMDNEEEAWEQLNLTYEAMNKPADALHAYKRFISIRDSLVNVDNAKKLTRIDVESKYDQIMAKDSIENFKKTTALNLKVQRQRYLSISGYIGIAFVLVMAFFIYRNFKNQKRANVIIAEEKQVSEKLLLNILPAKVAEELKTKGTAEAQHIDSATVLFTDFKGFTQLSEKLSPRELVAELNECFSAFDRIVQKNGVEKIKTIGDAYMAAGGLPVINTTHPFDVVSAALEIQKFMLEHKAQKEAAGELYFEIRIGVHTGPLVAGIVGLNKFAYDIWGDTVNTASRMESSGVVGQVNISHDTYELVKDKFSCTFRGEVQAKNKGQLKMYFVG